MAAPNPFCRLFLGLSANLPQLPGGCEGNDSESVPFGELKKPKAINGHRCELLAMQRSQSVHVHVRHLAAVHRAEKFRHEMGVQARRK